MSSGRSSTKITPRMSTDRTDIKTGIPMRPLTTKQTTVTAAVVVLCAAMAGTASASADQAGSAARTPARHCPDLTGLTETSYITVLNPGDATTHVGETGSTHSVITFADGKQLGVEDGTFVVYVDGAGVLSEMFEFTDTLTVGDGLGNGVIPLQATAAGDPEQFQVAGTSGRIKGLSGTWNFTLTSRPSAGESIFAVSLDLCG
jgi:hypothetical protein